MRNITVDEIVASYNAKASLAETSTIPAPWYVDERIAELERQTVFSRTWQVLGRIDQVEKPGQFVTATVAGEPLVAVRGNDGVLRAFYNVCRHHAAAVMTEPCGQASMLHCPYHGWNYGLDGSLKGMPEFEGVKNFERKDNGLVPVKVDTWEQFVFVNLDPKATPLNEFLGGLVKRTAPLGLSKLHYFTTKDYDIHCNWKVFVDNYLDGGYHVPHLHKGLNSVLDYKQYTIENEGRYSLQSSPLVYPGEPVRLSRGHRESTLYPARSAQYRCGRAGRGRSGCRDRGGDLPSPLIRLAGRHLPRATRRNDASVRDFLENQALPVLSCELWPPPARPLKREPGC